MKNPKRLNAILFSFLLLITGIALYHQLGDFAHLKNADGVLTDMRSLVLWDVRVPRIGLAILTGASLALAGNAMQGLFQNPLASPVCSFFIIFLCRLRYCYLAVLRGR